LKGEIVMAKNRCIRCGKYLVGYDKLDENQFCLACHTEVDGMESKVKDLIVSEAIEKNMELTPLDNNEEKTNLTPLAILFLIIQLVSAPLMLTWLLDVLYDLSIYVSGKSNDMGSFVDFVDSYIVVFVFMILPAIFFIILHRNKQKILAFIYFFVSLILVIIEYMFMQAIWFF